MKLLSKTLFMLFLATTMSAQNHPHCGTDEYNDALLKKDPSVAQEYVRAEAILSQKAASSKKSTAGVIYKVPVVIHVIYNSEYDNISRSQIMDAMRVLNEDYRRKNADSVKTRGLFLGVADDMEIEFELANKDPQGNCTDGINRVQSGQSINASNNVKDLVQWDSDRYMNVWVVNSINSSQSVGTILGYAYRPRFNQFYRRDGIVIRHDRMGTIGSGQGVSTGRTFTHEVGHYLGLLHPFSGGCNGGDNIADTPPVASSSFGCNYNKNSCSIDNPDLPDMIENFMDYADDVCQNIFTTGQKNVMRAALETAGLRQELRTSPNLVATGLTNPPACRATAMFSAENTFICPGQKAQFIDETEEGDPDTYTWYFPGGKPYTSNAANPLITYNTAGTYNVSLVVNNAAGRDSIFMENYMNVRPFYTNFKSQWIEGFESGLIIPQSSITSVGDDTKFKVTTNSSSQGASSLYLDNYAAQATGAVDAFISPNIFTDYADGLVLTFDYSFAAKDFSNDDELRIMASTDCGESWNLHRSFSGGQLRTASEVSNSPFAPGPGDWRNGFVPLSAYNGNGPVLIKFEFTNGGGNNLYLDNINFSASNVALEEVALENRISIFPNPTAENLSITWQGGAAGATQVSLFDLTGREVASHLVKKGQTQLNLAGSDFARGVYFIEVTEGKRSHTQKVVFN